MQPQDTSTHSLSSKIQERVETQGGLVETLKVKLDKERTFAERFADNMTDLAGNMPFLIVNVLAFAIWILLNVEIIPGLKPFDPYPFSFLTMTVSLEAIILAIFVLMSENRSAKVAALREEVDLQIDVITEYELTRLIAMVNALLQKLEVESPNQEDLDFMIKPLDIEKLEEGLERKVIKTRSKSSQ